jgi:hypothetical protein
MSEMMVWTLIMTFGMGHIAVIDNIASKQECNILSNKLKMVYNNDVKKTECFSVLKTK